MKLGTNVPVCKFCKLPVYSNAVILNGVRILLSSAGNEVVVDDNAEFAHFQCLVEQIAGAGLKVPESKTKPMVGEETEPIDENIANVATNTDTVRPSRKKK